ncbi:MULTISPECIES: hypothetical protein [Oerskovia]|uniref:Uncharacterized protein n=2 Tax=Oerskovia TaxID=162491 RepID=A0ABR8V5A6_9CELL|nr:MULTISPECIES: hypothetical protein [Oerskovia]MBD7999952.1 hypothetical protein [Oerskovia gallyi]MBM7496298.1 hypothetical protein [Oerskovia paurometabola]
MPRRLRLAGDTLEAILDEARREHGPDVRIVSAERVITGGIKGLFGRQHYEAVVEVASPAPSRPTEHPVRFPAARRAGIAALLDDADEADRLQPARSARSEDLEMSTGGDDFAAMLDELIAETALPEPARAPSQVGPSTAPGDLVALVGLGGDALPVARAMRARLGLLTGSAGHAHDGESHRVVDRRGATEARARGVHAGTATAVAVGVAADLVDGLRVLDELAPEQVWVVVDASRKHADTAAWVDGLRAVVHVHAMVVVGRSLTRTPETVQLLGLPEGWDAG